MKLIDRFRTTHDSDIEVAVEGMQRMGQRRGRDL